jgi:hypothetical protein
MLNPTGGAAPVGFAGIGSTGPACGTPIGGGISGRATGRPIESRTTDKRGTAAGL